MVSVYSENQTDKDVVASPKDEILNGVVVDIKKGILSEFVDPQYHGKFDNLTQETLYISYETKFNENTLTGFDKMPYYDKPMSNSKLGKYLTKYGELKVGQNIKVVYDKDGFGKIKID